ncbi:MAG: zinc-dependent metalloprotease, partial [Acidimicrobiales bacterium]
MPDPIDWDLARRVAVRVGGHDPFADSYHYASLGPDFAELTAEAEELVADATGLRSLAGPARARVTDRAGWVNANVASFSRLLRPVTDKLAERMSGRLAPIAAKATGAEVGALLGWMSTRVLGQYDLLVIEDEDPDDQDVVYYVGPNVLALEKRFAFPPRQFRLWLALHEVTHRAQFTGV